jgi:hypothetical protein
MACGILLGRKRVVDLKKIRYIFEIIFLENIVSINRASSPVCA